VPETCRELKNIINKSIKSGASSWFSARKIMLLVTITTDGAETGIPSVCRHVT
jgi:hypothetical protein